MNDDMRLINFSKGIRAEDIQHNFNAIQDQIARERLSVAGHGISSGLDFSIDKFLLTINPGSLVGVDGQNLFFDETKISIQLPRITTQRDAVYTVELDGRISLDNVPYATSRLAPSEYVLPVAYGITVSDYSNASKLLSVLSIDEKKIEIDARWAGKLVKVTHGFTNKRYDTVYIDGNYAIKVMEGITSSSPSVPMPTEYKYILGFIEVNPFAADGLTSKAAKMTVKKDMKNLRNVYTDENNVLYICGTPFEDLQIVHMIEPENPIDNQLWYDSVSNKLRVRRIVDGISQWVGVNDTSVIPVREYKIWTPQQNPAGRTRFIFHYEEDLNMRFVPGRNSLDLIIDQIPLHTDQFKELTIADASDPEIYNLLVSQYGYPVEILDSLSQDYENLGIGFQLGTALDKGCYVEARATHRVNENPLTHRFQRTATFVGTDSFLYSPEGGLEFNTNSPFRIKENQLEIFVDGKRLDPKTEYIEGSDLLEAERIRGTSSHTFKLIKDIASGSRISYKVTATIYSYDHVEKILGDLADKVVQAETTVQQTSAQVTEFITETNATVAGLSTAIQNVETKLLEHSEFVRKTDVLTMDNMPAQVVSWIPKGIINLSLVKSGTMNSVENIDPEDFVVMFDMQGSAGNSILIRGADYEITKDSTSGIVYVEFLDPNAVENGHTLYIIGLKFK